VSHDEIDARVRKTLALVLGVEPGAAVSRTDEPRWDSLKHVEIVFALEDAFDVRFDEDELATLDSAQALVAAVERRLAT
jgi:acyl carrier protein